MTVFALSHAAWLLMFPSMNIQGGAGDAANLLI